MTGSHFNHEEGSRPEPLGFVPTPSKSGIQVEACIRYLFRSDDGYYQKMKTDEGYDEGNKAHRAPPEPLPPYNEAIASYLVPQAGTDRGKLLMLHGQGHVTYKIL